MISTIITSTHVKGGSGTTLLSYNLACLIAKDHPNQVLFLQLCPGADIQSLLPHPCQYSFQDMLSFLEHNELNREHLGTLCQSHNGLDVIAMPPSYSNMLIFSKEIILKLLMTLKTHYRYICIDSPPLDPNLTPVFELSDAILFIGHADLPSTMLMNQYLEYAKKEGFFAKILVVINQLSKGLKLSTLEKKLKTNLFHALPFDQAAVFDTIVFAKAYIDQPHYPLSRATQKLWTKLTRFLRLA